MKSLINLIVFTLVFVGLLSFTYTTAKEVEKKPMATMPSFPPVQFEPTALPKLTPSLNITSLQREKIVAEINAYFEKALRKKRIVGAAVSIVKSDSVIYKGGYGARNSVMLDTVDSNTVFRLGSVSKGFASILTGMHVEQGLLHWDDKIVDHIPNFTLSSPEQTNQITLGNILSHTSGLPYHSYTDLVEMGVPIDTIAGRFKSIYPLQKVGETYSYQNAIYALSGNMIEKATDKTLCEVFENKIFNPLGMSSASTSYDALVTAGNVAQPHVRMRRGWRPVRFNHKYYGNAVAAGGVNASVSDMGKWMKFLLGNNPEVMMSKTMSDIFKPRIQVGGRRNYYQRWPGYTKSFYGYGWRVHSFLDKYTGDENRIIHHGGTVNNYRSEIAIYPEENLGICVLFNSQSNLARECVPAIHAIIQKILAKPKVDILQSTIAYK